MGAGSSTTTYQSTTYKLNDGNLTVNGPGQRMGNASSTASTDVKPSTQLSYSEDINLSWTGTLNNIMRGSRDVLQGTVGNNTQLLQSVKAIGSSALRVAGGDSDFRREVIDKVEGILSESVAGGIENIIDSTGQIATEKIRDVVEMQQGVVERMSVAGDAFQTVCLGMTGMRNNEVGTAPSSQSLLALKSRASEDERSREIEIMNVAGPRVGIIPRNKTTPEPDLIKNSIENAQTDYGRIGHLKDLAEEVTDEMVGVNFSILHAKALLLSRAGILRASHWETAQFAGTLNQVTQNFSAEVFPGGHKIRKEDYMNIAHEVSWSDTNQLVQEKAALTAYCYKLVADDLSRDIRLILNGSISIHRQPYKQTPIHLALIFYPKGGSGHYANKAVFINLEIDKQSSNSRFGSISSSTGVTNIMDDVDRHNIQSSTLLRKVEKDGSVLNFDDREELIEDGEVFSYVSQFSVAVNLSQVQLAPFIDVGANKECLAMLCVIGEDTELAIEVQTPILQISIITRPQEMSLLGIPYSGNVIDLLGEVEEWYSTIDPHDPISIYENLLKPIIIRSATIARYHVKDGAAYALTVEHVRLARSQSGLSQLTDEDMSEHIIGLMTWVSRWMYKGGPVAQYAKQQRKFLFMRIVENVMFHSLGHIEVFADRYNELTSSYLKDCNEYNIREQTLDRLVIADSKK